MIMDLNDDNNSDQGLVHAYHKNIIEKMIRIILTKVLGITHNNVYNSDQIVRYELKAFLTDKR